MAAIEETSAGPGGHPLLDWGVAQRAKIGEVESGDHYVVRPSAEHALLAVIDGLGHGTEAAAAARRAIGMLEGAGAGEPIVALLKRCHAALQGTRGAVVGLASFSARESGMQWLGIGNIQGVVLRSHPTARPRLQPLLSRGGIVGHRLPRLLVSTIPFGRGDLVVLATDGIDTDFVDRLTPGVPAQELADRILAQHGRESDDALVLVVRYLGQAP